MAVSFLSGINLNQNQLLQARIENVGTDPTNGVLGQIIFNTTSNILKVCTVGSPTAAVFSQIGSAGATYTLPVGVAGANSAVISLTDNSNVVASTVTFNGTTNQIAVSEVIGNNGSVTIGLAPAITIAGPITLTGTGQSSFAGQITIPTTPVAATDAASKGYVDSVVAGGVVWQAGYNASTGLPNLVNPVAGTIKKGYMWTVTADGLAFYSVQLRVGDSLIANVLNPTLVTDWTIIQSNIDIATDAVFGLVKLGNSTVQSASAAAIGTAALRTYSVQFNSNSQLVVNVPWTDSLGSIVAATTNNLLGINVASSMGIATVGLTINGLTDIGTDTAASDVIPIYDQTAATNKKVSLTNLATRVNEITSFSNTGPATTGTSYTISAVSHGLGPDAKLIMVQLLLESTGETIFADVTRGPVGDITITFAASQTANSIRALLQKISL